MTIHTHIVIPVKPLVMPIAFLELFSFFSAPVPILHAHPIASSKLAANYMNFLPNVAL